MHWHSTRRIRGAIRALREVISVRGRREKDLATLSKRRGRRMCDLEMESGRVRHRAGEVHVMGNYTSQFPRDQSVSRALIMVGSCRLHAADAS